MSQWWYEWGAPVIFLALVLVCVIAGAVWLGQASCDAATANIGFPHRWSLLGRCQIQVSDGRWLPLDNYREFNR